MAPAFEHSLQKIVAIFEVPIKAALRHIQFAREAFDAYLFNTTVDHHLYCSLYPINFGERATD